MERYSTQHIFLYAAHVWADASLFLYIYQPSRAQQRRRRHSFLQGHKLPMHYPNRVCSRLQCRCYCWVRHEDQATGSLRCVCTDNYCRDGHVSSSANDHDYNKIAARYGLIRWGKHSAFICETEYRNPEKLLNFILKIAPSHKGWAEGG